MSKASPPTLAQALFAPRSVALIGASGDATKNTSRPQRFLRKHADCGMLEQLEQHGAELGITGTLDPKGAS